MPAFLSMLIWVMSSALFVWMEHVYDGPSKYFFTSVATGMYWTSSFLIGAVLKGLKEWLFKRLEPIRG